VPQKTKIKVLIVEDVLVVRSLLSSLVRNDSRFELIGTAENGLEALKFLKINKPDVISMDIHMPLMDGFDTTRKIMETSPVPIVIVSGSFDASEVHHSFKALEAGAVSIILTPSGPGHPEHVISSENYLITLALMSEIKVVRRINRDAIKDKNDFWESKQPITEQILLNKKKPSIVVIGASAGGPFALQSILAGLPADFPLPIMIVQHIDPGFACGFSEWLGSSSKLTIKCATDGEILMPGTVYLSPGDFHLGFRHQGVISLVKDIPMKTVFCPSVNYLFKTTAQFYQNAAVGVLLSGMGSDGALELKEMNRIGATTIVQDEQSALVYGMPGEALKLEKKHLVLSPENIVRLLVQTISNY
jgi:two-component system chemotaxis response regulator CheB